MRRTLLSLPVLAAVLIGAPAAHATGWVSSQPLSPADRLASDPQAALTPGGDTIAAWIERDTSGGAANVSVRSARTGGDFGPAQSFAGQYESLQAATGRDGTVALAWTDFRNHSIHVARRRPGEATFTEATPVVPTRTEDLSSIEIAVSQGDVYVSTSSFTGFQTTTASSIWLVRLAAGGNAVQVVRGAAANGAVEHVSFVPPAPEVFLGRPSLAVDDGKVVVAWDQDNPGAGTIRGTTAIRFAAGGPAGVAAPARLGTLIGTNTSAPGAGSVTAAAGGRSYIAFHDRDRVDFVDLANPGTIVPIPADTRFPTDLRVGADSSGALVAAWEAEPATTDNPLVTAAVVPAGAAPPKASRLSPAGPARTLDDLAVASDGTALVLPDRTASSFATALQVDGVLRPAGGAFGPAEDITGPRDAPRNGFHAASAAVLPGGRAVAVWSAADNSGTPNQRVHVSERDTTPPALGTIAAPATTTVGEPASFAATASDVLSGITIDWDFGDGSQADGETVRHTFGTAGAATVTVTATDAAGNSVREQRVVAVQPAPRTDDDAGTPPTDGTPPAVTGLSLSHRRFRVARTGTTELAAARTKRSPAGTALRLGLSERATLVVSIERRKVVRGTLVRASAGPGRVTIPFTGRIGRTALPAGSYTATVTAIDGTGNTSKPVRVKFTVLKK